MLVLAHRNLTLQYNVSKFNCSEGLPTYSDPDINEEPGTDQPVSLIPVIGARVSFRPVQRSRDEKGLREGECNKA